MDRMESQIQFSAEQRTADDYVKLNRIRDEQRDLKTKLEELTRQQKR